MDKIYDEYYNKIYHWALNKTHNKEEAEDLTNNVFVAIFEYLNKDIKIDVIDNLIWKIAHNLWCTRAKRYIKEKDIIKTDAYEELGYIDISIDKIIYKEIVNNIDNIGLTEKEILSFKMYYLHDLSIAEISQKINSSESNIKYYLYSARNKIKERYND